MTTTFTIKNHGPGLLDVREHRLGPNGEDTQSYSGRHLEPGLEMTVMCHKHQRVTVEEVVRP